MTQQPSTEERVARYLAATDWIEDPADDAWWNSRITKFREDYLTSARRIIAIVHGADLAAASAGPPEPCCVGLGATACAEQNRINETAEEPTP